MNFPLKHIPERTRQPRSNGLTMISDKGMSNAELEDLISVAGPYIDMVKLAFGTALVTPNLKEKIDILHQHKIPVYFGGILFEAYVARKQFGDYRKLMEQFGLSHV